MCPALLVYGPFVYARKVLFFVISEEYPHSSGLYDVHNGGLAVGPFGGPESDQVLGAFFVSEEGPVPR